MLFDFANVLIFLFFAIFFVSAALLVSKIVAPRTKNLQKAIPYECGEIPIGTPWIRFNPRYFFFALLFLIFEVEIALMIPCAVIYRQWIEQGRGWLAFAELFCFVLVFIIGFFYLWKKGVLSWIRHISVLPG